MIKKMLYYLNYYWRVFATGLSFFVFGIGGILLGYIVLTIISLMTKNQRQKQLRAQHAISITFKIFVFIMESLRVISFEFINIEKLSKDTGCVLVSNHPTLIDIVVLISKMKFCNIIIKQQLWKNPFMKRVLQIAGYIPNTKSEDISARIIESLSRGDNLLIFPEGSRSIPSQPLTLQRGAAQIAIRTPAQIRLIRIKCSPSGLAKHDKWYKVPAKKVEYVVEVGERIDPAEFLENAAGLPSLAARHLTQYLKEALEKDMSLGRSHL